MPNVKPIPKDDKRINLIYNLVKNIFIEISFEK